MRTFALIPAYNEAQTTYKVVTEVKKYVDEVIVIDDGSLDQTSSEARRGGAFILRHIVNRGQGAALQTGFEFIKETEFRRTLQRPRYIGEAKEGNSVSADFLVITFDADAQFEPSEISRLIEPITNGEVDVVLGSRFLGIAPNIPKTKKLFLRCAIMLTNLLTGLKLTDTHNGFRALSGKAVGLITITQDRMAHGSEILFEIVKHNLTYQEIPVTVKYSAYSLSKGQKFGDYLKILFDLFIRKLVQ